MPWFNRGSASDNEPKVTASLQSGNTVLVNLEAQVHSLNGAHGSGSQWGTCGLEADTCRTGCDTT
jgi:hypothetical protein